MEQDQLEVIVKGMTIILGYAGLSRRLMLAGASATYAAFPTSASRSSDKGAHTSHTTPAGS
jgi:hypothetical protein